MGGPFEHTEGPPHGTDRRAHSRWRVRSLVYVEPEPGNGGIVLDASEGGICVQVVGGLAGDELGSMRLQMPGGRSWVDAPARVVWAQNARRLAGLQFATMSDEARRRIGVWLSELDESRIEASARSSENEARATSSSEPAAPPIEYVPPIIAPVRAPELLAARRDFARPFEDQLPRRRPRSGIMLAIVAALLALASLAVGWAIGRGDLPQILARIHSQSAPQGERPSNAPVPARQ